MKLTEDNKNKSVITTKYIVENKSTIVSVFYDEDGDWQFFGEEEVTESDARVISIGQILEIDNSLMDLPNIVKVQSLFRNNKNSLCQIRN